MKNAVSYLVLTALSVITLAPLILLASNTFKTEAQFHVDPFGFPTTFTLSNIVEAWTEGGYARAYVNTFCVAVVVMVVVLFCAGLAAYALSKFQFRWADPFMGYLLFTMSIPIGMFLVPLFFLWQKLHLMNSLAGLTIIYCGLFLPFNVFLIRSYFIGIPNEIRESGLVDGASEFGVFWRIFVPLSKPVFFTAALIIGVWTWNEFFFANAFLLTDDIKTVAVRYATFTGKFNQDWSLISAGGFVSMFPILVLYLLLQKRFIQGIMEGSLKG
ncbi:MAG: carbohydrate ABC transporter permease [Alicyclobacillus sp.]|nr:carbohydrate ABC transporter permease [Alicyclobacillus sp.]